MSLHQCLTWIIGLFPRTKTAVDETLTLAGAGTMQREIKRVQNQETELHFL